MAIPGINDVPNISGLKASPADIGRMPQDDQQAIMRAMQQKAGGQPAPQTQAMPGGGAPAPAPAPSGDPQMPPQATTAELSGAAKMAQGVMSGREQQGNDLMAAHPAPKAPTEEDMRITPNQAQAFLPLLMGLASLAGNRSSPAMMSSMQSMNAMMETQMEGNNSITKHHEEQMWKQFDAATAAHKEEMTILMPKFKALQSGSPESLEEARMALHEAGIKSSTIDQLFNGDSTKNLQSWIIAKEKLEMSAEKQADMLRVYQARIDSNEKIAAGNIQGRADAVDKANVGFKSLTPEEQGVTYNSIVNNEEKFTDAFPSRGKTAAADRAHAIAEIKKTNPKWTEQSYDLVKKFEGDKRGDAIRFTGVALEHQDELKKLSAALKNGNMPIVNQIYNRLAPEFGGTAPGNFDSVSQFVSDETVKSVLGTAGGVTDREAAQGMFANKKTPQAMAEVIDNIQGLMGSQLAGLKRQYLGMGGTEDRFNSYLSDAQKNILDKNRLEHGSIHSAAGGGGAAHPQDIQNLLDKYK